MTPRTNASDSFAAPKTDAPRPDPETVSEAVCDTCGAPEATRIGDETLCVDCYAERGACCAGDADDCDV